MRNSASRDSMFAVWRWPWWAWVVIAVLVPVVYLLSAVPVWYVLGEVYYFQTPDPVLLTVRSLYWPALVLDAHSEIAHAVFCWQYSLLTPDDVPDNVFWS